MSSIFSHLTHQAFYSCSAAYSVRYIGIVLERSKKSPPPPSSTIIINPTFLGIALGVGHFTYGLSCFTIAKHIEDPSISIISHFAAALLGIGISYYTYRTAKQQLVKKKLDTIFNIVGAFSYAFSALTTANLEVRDITVLNSKLRSVQVIAVCFLGATGKIFIF